MSLGTTVAIHFFQLKIYGHVMIIIKSAFIFVIFIYSVLLWRWLVHPLVVKII